MEYPKSDKPTSTDGPNVEATEFLSEFAARLRSLTDKEMIVLQSVLDSQTNIAISMALKLTQRTIELRRASILRKLDVHSHTELVRRMTRFEMLTGNVAHHVRERPIQSE